MFAVPASRIDRGSLVASLRHAIPVALAAAVLFCSGHARAQQAALYDNTRVLEHNGRECSGVAACRTVRAGRFHVKAGQTQEITVQCPEATPYFIAWDSEQTENITALVRSRPSIALNPDGTQPGPEGRLLIAAHNEAQKGGGHITLFLGCAATQISPSNGIMRSRAGIPSNAPTFASDN